MPKEDKNIEGVLKGDADEDILDAISVQEKISNPDGKYGADDIDVLESEMNNEKDNSYYSRIQKEMQYLKDNSSKFLSPNTARSVVPDISP